MLKLIIVVAALLSTVLSRHLPTRGTPTSVLGGQTNAERLANGYAPAWPQALQHYSRSQGRPRLRRQGGPGPSATPTCRPPTATPTVVLDNPIILYDSSRTWDDYYSPVEVPFPIQIYDANSTTVYVSTNGLLSLGFGSSAYSNGPLPEVAIPGQSRPVSPSTIFAFWDDTYIAEGTKQGIYYQIFNNDTITIEYYFSHFSDYQRYFHYAVTASSGNPGVFTVNYYEISDSGASATVGSQGLAADGSGPFVQYSFDEPKILPGTILSIDTVHNVITQVQEGECDL